MFAQERHNAIRKIVHERQRINFGDLQALVPVSPATLRRDLADLEKVGALIRVHGGVFDPAYLRSEISFDERLRRNQAEKRAVATAAAALVPAGASVFVDAGSTCLEAGKILLARKNVRVITHSVALVTAAQLSESDLLCIGGELRPVSGALVGAGALGSLTALHADFALIGASGVNAEGIWTTELTEAEMKTAILAISSRRLLLADSSKWANASTIRFARWPEITDWITDRPLPKKASSILPRDVAVHWPKAD